MKYTLLTAILLSISSFGMAQETFEHKEGDTTYLMQKYFMCFLSEGPLKDIDTMQRRLIIQEHLIYQEKVFKKGKISLAGPLEGKGDMRGIVIYHTATIEEAWKLAYADPAVDRGVFTANIRPWWAAKGSQLK